MPVGKRADCTRIKSKGFFPGAKVTRGKDWQWADQDGGDVGTLTAIMSWYETPRSGANVSWNILRENNYRTGYLGKVSFWFGLLFIIIVVIVIIIIIIIIVEGKGFNTFTGHEEDRILHIPLEAYFPRCITFS